METENNLIEAEVVAENLLRRIINGLIVYKDKLEIIKIYSGGNLTKYTLRCAVADAPRIMGRAGMRYRSYRFLLTCMGRKFDRQLMLDNMLDPESGQPEHFPLFKFNPAWPKAEITKLLEDVCAVVFRFNYGVELIDGAGSAIFKIMYDPRESSDFIHRAIPHFQNLFQGIGVTNGCQISVDMEPYAEL